MQRPKGGGLIRPSLNMRETTYGLRNMPLVALLAAGLAANRRALEQLIVDWQARQLSTALQRAWV
jgi:hypothetical protein